MPPQVKKVVTYSRVSTSHHFQNPEVQIQELRRFCAAREWSITHEVVDHGFKGGSYSRPGLQKLMSLVRSREVDAVVVVKMDRLFRSLKHLINTLDEWEALGVLFVATKDNVDYTTPSGKLFVQILGSLAQFEKSLVRERTLMGLAHAVASGKTLGRPLVNNYDRIVTLRGQGFSYRSIQRELNCSSGAINRALRAASKSPEKREKDSGFETRSDED